MKELKWKKGLGALDFSMFHDILVEDFDGNVQPMDEPKLAALLSDFEMYKWMEKLGVSAVAAPIAAAVENVERH